MPLKLYGDECWDRRVSEGLRRRELDIVTAHELNLLGASDEVHLERASASGRVIVTQDSDFLRLANEFLTAGREFPGVIHCRPGIPVGEAIRQIQEIALTRDPASMVNQIAWVT